MANPTGPSFDLPAPSSAVALRAARRALDDTEAALDFVAALRASAARLAEAAEALRAAHPEGDIVDELCSSVAGVQRVASRVAEATCSAGARVSALGLIVSARALADEAARLAERG
jgi:hypothetical protein